MKAKRISKAQLTVGLYIKLPLSWHEHPFMRGAFQIRSDEEILALKQLPTDYLLYIPEKSSCEPLQLQKEVIAEAAEQYDELEFPAEAAQELFARLNQTKQHQIHEMTELRARQAECAKRYKQSVAMLRKGIEDFGRSPERACDEINQLSSNILDLAGDGPLTLNLVDRPISDDKHFSHTLNVAVLSLIVGRERGYSQSELTELITGAFLHDVGMIDVNKPFGLDGKVPLTAAATHIEKHTDFGVRMLQGLPGMDEPILKIISNHHECYDGSGYPKGLKTEQLDEMSQIVAIADAYDDLCEPQKGRKSMRVRSAMSELFRNMKHKFHPDLLQFFIKVVGIYPPGSVVLLSDGSVAMVLSNNPDVLLKPNVVMFDRKVPRDKAPILALTDTELTVQQVVKRDMIPEQVYDYLCPSSRFFYFFNTEDKG